MVDEELGIEYAKSNGLIFYETSARSGENVHAIFHTLAEHIVVDQKTINQYRQMKTFHESRKGSCCSG